MSDTEKVSIYSSSVLSSFTIERVIDPFSVNLTELFIKLMSICRILNASPIRREGIDLSISTTIFISFPPTLFSIKNTMSEIVFLISYSDSIISILPFSSFDISRMSLTISKRALPLVSIVFRYCNCFSERESLLERRISVIPTMAFIGVLISWETTETNLLFDRLASSALAFSF